MNYLAFYILFAGLWALVNGILHSVSVLMQERPFEKDLIRLLIDGHLLIFAGIFFLLSYRGIRNNEAWAYKISVAAALFLLGYCALIFKMLPSVATIAINFVAFIWLVSKMLRTYNNR